jgi:hypothetical protein
MSDPFEMLHDDLVRVGALAAHRSAAGSRRRAWSRYWLRRPLVLAIVLIGASASAGGLALAGTFNNGTINPQAWVNGQRVQPEATITPDQTTSLEILRRQQAASDALDSYDSHALADSPTGGGDGVNVSLARRAQGFTSGAAWVIPANDGNICLVSENAQAVQMTSEPRPWDHEIRVPGANGVTDCEPASQVNTGWPLAYGSSGDGPAGTDFTAGIVPDGVSHVTVTVADGDSLSLPVHENVWMGEVPGTPTSVTFTGPNGPVTSSGNSSGPPMPGATPATTPTN